ncbi:unnamed protein product [Caenorhabditis auriculariae]|uniref:Uracil-DNA glycosylase n=1 Tax=Caenorhabditis auriculariae TaxID=2777116 RepID=A0A8S1H4A2_9PELO|nr:unnamed protein product [Caenorhabditis auriculariae]
MAEKLPGFTNRIGLPSTSTGRLPPLVLPPISLPPQKSSDPYISLGSALSPYSSSLVANPQMPSSSVMPSMPQNNGFPKSPYQQLSFSQPTVFSASLNPKPTTSSQLSPGERNPPGCSDSPSSDFLSQRRQPDRHSPQKRTSDRLPKRPNRTNIDEPSTSSSFDSPSTSVQSQTQEGPLPLDLSSTPDEAPSTSGEARSEDRQIRDSAAENIVNGLSKMQEIQKISQGVSSFKAAYTKRNFPKANSRLERLIATNRWPNSSEVRSTQNAVPTVSSSEPSQISQSSSISEEEAKKDADVFVNPTVSTTTIESSSSNGFSIGPISQNRTEDSQKSPVSAEAETSTPKAEEQPLEPSEKPLEPSEQPLEPSEQPLEPSEQPLEPSEQPPPQKEDSSPAPCSIGAESVASTSKEEVEKPPSELTIDTETKVEAKEKSTPHTEPLQLEIAEAPPVVSRPPQATSSIPTEPRQAVVVSKAPQSSKNPILQGSLVRRPTFPHQARPFFAMPRTTAPFLHAALARASHFQQGLLKPMTGGLLMPASPYHRIGMVPRRPLGFAGASHAQMQALLQRQLQFSRASAAISVQQRFLASQKLAREKALAASSALKAASEANGTKPSTSSALSSHALLARHGFSNAAIAAVLKTDRRNSSVKEQYRIYKSKFKNLVYENECYQNQLRNLQRKLLKLSRDKNFLMDRLAQFENCSDSSEEEVLSDGSVKTDDGRPAAKRRRAKRTSPSMQKHGESLSPSPSPIPEESSGASPSENEPGPSGANDSTNQDDGNVSSTQSSPAFKETEEEPAGAQKIPSRDEPVGQPDNVIDAKKRTAPSKPRKRDRTKKAKFVVKEDPNLCGTDPETLLQQIKLAHKLKEEMAKAIQTGKQMNGAHKKAVANRPSGKASVKAAPPAQPAPSPKPESAEATVPPASAPHPAEISKADVVLDSLLKNSEQPGSDSLESAPSDRLVSTPVVLALSSQPAPASTSLEASGASITDDSTENSSKQYEVQNVEENLKATGLEASMNSKPIVKIPEMFLKAANAKRSNTESSEFVGSKRTKSDSVVAKVDEKENRTSLETAKVDTVASEVKVFSISESLRSKPWFDALQTELSRPYIRKIETFLSSKYAAGQTIFPPREEIFTAFDTDLNDIRVVLIGQDPYHNDGQAHGLAFSVKHGVRPPPSLVNIYKELEVDIPGFKRPSHGCLNGWAEQGVFLLNATLTVKAHEANSHANIGWQQFTDAVISLISKTAEKPVVFLLWGGFAHKKEALINKAKHVVIKTAHPSPLSARKWFGCRCFSKVNESLLKSGREPVDWANL